LEFLKSGTLVIHPAITHFSSRRGVPVPPSGNWGGFAAAARGPELLTTVSMPLLRMCAVSHTATHTRRHTTCNFC